MINEEFLSYLMNIFWSKEKIGLVICLKAYQLFMGYLMQEFDSFVNV